MKEKLLELVNAYKKYEKRKIFVWGAGNTALLYQKGFERKQIDNIVCYIDSNPLLWGKRIKGVEVISPEKMLEIDKVQDTCIVLICTSNILAARQIVKNIEKTGVPSASLDHYIFYKMREELMQTYDLLVDDKSKAIYYQTIRSRILFEDIKSEYYEKEAYFALSEFKTNSNEVFVDLGAYVGDTVEKYIWEKSGQFNRIYAFEPDKVNYNAMKYRVKRLKKEWAIDDKKIQLIYGGIGAESSQVCMMETDKDHTRLGSRIATEEEKQEDQNRISMYSIDDYFVDEKVSFIKADIEGYEYDMLKGAMHVIQRDLPKLALCIYHNAMDMVDIPLLVKNISSDYDIAIRHHSFSCLETVLYAYPKIR